jgi:hypothetical protein
MTMAMHPVGIDLCIVRRRPPNCAAWLGPRMQEMAFATFAASLLWSLIGLGIKQLFPRSHAGAIRTPVTLP